MIECLPSCHSEANPPKYPPINAGQFSKERSELHAPGAKASGEHLTEDPRGVRYSEHAGQKAE